MCHHTWLIFVILVEIRFHYVGQAGLELQTSSDPPALASQNAGITGFLPIHMHQKGAPQPLPTDYSWITWTTHVTQEPSDEPGRAIHSLI
ncbi:hypothetical protein AAY473_011710 [Plecturocebus cupreus]